MGMVEPSEQEHLRIRLLETLRYVISQRLVPKIGGGRQLIQEVMGVNLRVREVLANGEGEGRSFYDITDANASFGWTTFDQSLLQAFVAGYITEDTALLYATHRNKLTRMLDDAKKRLGQLEPRDAGLRLDGHEAPPAAAAPGSNLRLSA